MHWKGSYFSNYSGCPIHTLSLITGRKSSFLTSKTSFRLSVDGLWRTFWQKSICCPHHPGSRFYTVEEARSIGRLGGLVGAELLQKLAVICKSNGILLLNLHCLNQISLLELMWASLPKGFVKPWFMDFMHFSQGHWASLIQLLAVQCICSFSALNFVEL